MENPFKKEIRAGLLFIIAIVLDIVLFVPMLRIVGTSGWIENDMIRAILYGTMFMIIIGATLFLPYRELTSDEK